MKPIISMVAIALTASLFGTLSTTALAADRRNPEITQENMNNQRYNVERRCNNPNIGQPAHFCREAKMQYAYMQERFMEQRMRRLEQMERR